jgi:hypothetical protein
MGFIRFIELIGLIADALLKVTDALLKVNDALLKITDALTSPKIT